MIRFVLFLCFSLSLTAPVWAQEDIVLEELLESLRGIPSEPVIEAPKPAQSTQAAELRFLDRMTGRLETHILSVQSPFEWHDLNVTLYECRYPAENIAGDAYAYLVVTDNKRDYSDTSLPDSAEFRGWMVASSPALNAMEHARYDVWVLRCITS